MDNSFRIELSDKEEAIALLPLYQQKLKEVEDAARKIKRRIEELEAVAVNKKDHLEGGVNEQSTQKGSISGGEWEPKDWKKKVLITLEHLNKESYSGDIIDYLHSKMPSLKRSKIGKSVSSALHSLHESKTIVKKEDERGLIFTLPAWYDKQKELQFEHTRWANEIIKDG